MRKQTIENDANEGTAIENRNVDIEQANVANVFNSLSEQASANVAN